MICLKSNLYLRIVLLHIPLPFTHLTDHLILPLATPTSSPCPLIHPSFTPYTCPSFTPCLLSFPSLLSPPPVLLSLLTVYNMCVLCGICVRKRAETKQWSNP